MTSQILLRVIGMTREEIKNNLRDHTCDKCMHRGLKYYERGSEKVVCWFTISKCPKNLTCDDWVARL